MAAWTAPRVLALVGDWNGCTMFRVVAPFAELQRQGAPVGAAEWGWKDDPRLALLAERFDAVLLARLSWGPGEREAGRRWVDALHRAGKWVWYEVDDDLFSPWIVPQAVRAGIRPEETAAAKEQARLDRIAALQLCDGVTVTSQRLATVVRQYTSAPIEVVPNAIDWRWAKAVLREGTPRQVAGLTVGWAGGARPDDDVAPMAWAWGQLAQTHPEVTFVVQGHQPRAIYDAFEDAGVPRERLVAIGWLPLHAYLVGLRNVDVACCPLADAPFNRSKSPVKCFEAAAAGADGRGAAVVASPTVYRQVLTHGEDGYLATSGEEWLAALTRLVEDASERRRVARNLRRRVATAHGLEGNAWRWPAAWTRLAAAAPEGAPWPPNARPGVHTRMAVA
jgi:glycosyltransferase involved in cell wall biosynthesis